MAVDGDAGFTVVVEALSVAAFLVRVQIDAAGLERRRFNQVDGDVGFAQLMMTSAGVGENLHAVEPHGNVRRLRSPQLEG